MTAIFSFLTDGGLYFTLPLTIFAAIIVFYTVKSGLELFVAERVVEQRTSKNLDIIMYLGSFSFVFGILGQMIGLYYAFQFIAENGDVSPRIMASGLKVSMITTMYGLGIFLLASICWFVLRRKYKSLV